MRFAHRPVMLPAYSTRLGQQSFAALSLALWLVACAPDPGTGVGITTGGRGVGTGGSASGSGGVRGTGGVPGPGTGGAGLPASGGSEGTGGTGAVNGSGGDGSSATGGSASRTGGAGAGSGGANATATGGGGAASGGRAAVGGGNGSGGATGGPVVAFPGAEGYGRNSLGGRGGAVCHVTTLADSGAGSLRDCVSQGNRTVVFDVGGWITLANNLAITQSNITIAGQTAPGAGIGIRGFKFSVGGANIVLRFLRVRYGVGSTPTRNDAMTVSSAASNVIIDHCSISFGTDETLSMPGDEGIGPRNLTLQWSIVAYGLQRDNHSAGSLFTSNQTTIHHTLWAFNKTRNPRARSEMPETRGQGGPLDWVNNVIYGWNAPDPVGEPMGWSISHDPFILAGTANGQHAANAVGNVFISRRPAGYAFHKGSPNFSLFVADNILDGNANGMLDSSKTGTAMIQGTPTMLAQRLPTVMVATDPARTAYDRVLADVGATLPARDQVDALVVSHVRAQTGNLIQTEQDLVAQGVGDRGYGTLANAARPADFDTDRDGMPNAWEGANGLNSNSAADGNGDADGDGYTNLEEYLSSLVP